MFGAQGNAKHDGVSEKLSFASPASYWKNGKNIVIFKHTKSQGFTVENLEVAFSSTPPPPPPVLTGIKPYKNNNSYWEYEGKPILLIGGFSQTSQPFLQTKSDLIKELDATKANGGNYIRNTMAVFKKTKIQNVSPFVRLGNGKFDLDQINNAYYDYLRVLFEEAHKRQIIVQLELWDPLYFYGNAWVTSPWAPSNNINYSSADTGIPDTFTAKPYTEVNKIYYSVKDANKASVLKYQEAFVKKVLEVAKPFDNIIYQIENEEMKKVQPLSNDWADYWANFIKDNAGKTAYVTHMPADYDLLTSAKQDHVLKKTSSFGFLDISQGGMGLTNQKRYELILKYVNKVKSGPKVRPVNSTKIYKWRSSTSSETSDEIAINRMWHNVFAGVAAVRFHRPGAGIDTPSVALRQTKSMRYFANSLDITKMIPNNGILSKRSSDEAYAMSEKKGKTHAVYFTGSSDRSVNINLNSASGNLQLTWYNTQTGETKSGGTISGGGTLTLTTPSSNSWVAILK